MTSRMQLWILHSSKNQTIDMMLKYFSWSGLEWNGNMPPIFTNVLVML